MVDEIFIKQLEHEPTDKKYPCGDCIHLKTHSIESMRESYLQCYCPLILPLGFWISEADQRFMRTKSKKLIEGPFETRIETIYCETFTIKEN